MRLPNRRDALQHKAVWGPDPTKAVRIAGQIVSSVVVLVFGLAAAALADGRRSHEAATSGRHSRQVQHVDSGQPNNQVNGVKVDQETTRRTRGARSTDKVSVIVIQEHGADLPWLFKAYAKRYFRIINGYELIDLPAFLVSTIGAHASTHGVHFNRTTKKHDALSSAAVNANAVDAAHLISQQLYPYTGNGVRVAVIDSGFSRYSTQDLTDDRIAFLNFLDTDQTRHDGEGHGTHVAGIIGGTGSLNPKYAGIAPGTSVLSLKVLGDNGAGTIGDTIAALDWVYTHPEANVRVINLSVGAPVTESYLTDPLTLATKALVDRGVVIVTAAGNFGKNRNGQLQWGGITSPGIAPWVITVCAFTTQGTYDTSDDIVAGFSSSGPTAVDFGAKPDICAPGVGIVSLSDPASRLYNAGAMATPSWLIGGDPTGYAVAPYESLSGTSMATPFVTGAVALMLEANPRLTPNLVKAILEYTAHARPGVSALRQGAGFMDVAGAVGLAAAYSSLPLTTSVNHAAPPIAVTSASVTPVAKVSMPMSWSKRIIWGNHALNGGVLDPYANAWAVGTRWGAAQASNGDNIVWGTTCGVAACDNLIWGVSSAGDNIVWGTMASSDNIVWGTAAQRNNIVWGTASASDNIVWGTATASDNIVWGTAFDGINIVWGTAAPSDNIVWGTDCGGADCVVVWGSADSGDNIVWGTASAGDNIVWGTAGSLLDNIVWGTVFEDNGVWRTAFDADNIVWGTALVFNVVWGGN
jgi:subtilisin family serine protease